VSASLPTLDAVKSIGRLPVARSWRGRHYDRAMTTMMSAALPATALVHPIGPVGIMPRGLTDTDGERIAAAIGSPYRVDPPRLRRRLEPLGAVVHAQVH
jgi:hypothetical protein